MCQSTQHRRDKNGVSGLGRHASVQAYPECSKVRLSPKRLLEERVDVVNRRRAVGLPGNILLPQKWKHGSVKKRDKHIPVGLALAAKKEDEIHPSFSR